MEIWTPAHWNRQPYMKWAGAQVLHAVDGRSTVELLVQKHHRGAVDTQAVNGAILAYLHDVTQGSAVRSRLGADVISIATISLNVDFVGLMEADEAIHVDGSVLRIGGGLAFAQSEVRNAAGVVCSRATGTFRIRRERPGSGPAPAAASGGA